MIGMGPQKRSSMLGTDSMDVNGDKTRITKSLTISNNRCGKTQLAVELHCFWNLHVVNVIRLYANFMFT